VGVLAALGTLVYTQVLYQKAPITETAERERLAKLRASPLPAAVPGVMMFDPMTVNIRANPGAPRPADGSAEQLHGKLHYVTMGFALELRDDRMKEKLEELRPILLDGILSLVGRKAFNELANVQGRYLLRTQILDLVNDAAKRAATETRPGRAPDAPVTNVYFTQFVVQ
jgi:flagellar basal body-associated protein FliL